nr:TetR family transcriptional regulator [Modestobacter versicolor]
MRTAVAMADQDGLDAVTLRRIAAELGVHVTSLYNHVPTRDAVTDGIVETLLEEAGLPADAVGWEEWVRAFFTAMGTLAAAHPGAYAALQRRPVQGPRAAASFEVALGAFADAGLGDLDAYNAVKATALTALVVGLERSMSTRGPLPATAIEALPREGFPRFHGLRDLDEPDDPEAAWSFSLETLVAGLRVQVDRLAGAAGPTG